MPCKSFNFGRQFIVDGVADGYEAFALVQTALEIAPDKPVLFVARDGQRFLGMIDASRVTQSGTAETPQIQVVLNWFDELKRRAPVAGVAEISAGCSGCEVDADSAAADATSRAAPGTPVRVRCSPAPTRPASRAAPQRSWNSSVRE